MSERTSAMRTCVICGRHLAARQMVSGISIHESIARTIRREHPQWSQQSYICRHDLDRLRAEHVHSLLESEKGELTSLEREVLASLRERELLATNVETDWVGDRTFADRLADRLAAFGGSWSFLIAFAIFLVFWIGMNSLVLFWRPADPYPFILLNLLLSCLAAVQAPIIMMSQNRKEAKDRQRSEHDYQVNLKAELEIRHLHEKVDHLLTHQWERLFEIQEIQVELLSDINRNQ